MIGKFKGVIKNFFTVRGTNRKYLLIEIDKAYERAADSIMDEVNVLPERAREGLMFSISQYKNSRTLRQNRMMWALLEKMAEHLNGGRAGGVTAWDCYIDMLELCGAKFEYIMCIPEAVCQLKNVFRAIKEVEHRNYNGTDMVVCKCFYGSSTFDTKEMTMLIDGIIDKSYQFGIYDAEFESLVAEWREIKNE